MHGAKRRLNFARRTGGAALGALLALFMFTPAWAAPQGPNHVRDVKVHAAEGLPGTTDIEIVGTVAPVYNVRVAEGGKRLLIDLSDADVAGAPAAITQGVGAVGGVLTQGFKTEAGQITRLTVSL